VLTPNRQIGDNISATLAVHSIEPPLSRAVSSSTRLLLQATLPAPRSSPSRLTGDRPGTLFAAVIHAFIAAANSAFADPHPLRLQHELEFPK
jgi:hypothetical protein